MNVNGLLRECRDCVTPGGGSSSKSELSHLKNIAILELLAPRGTKYNLKICMEAMHSLFSISIRCNS